MVSAIKLNVMKSYSDQIKSLAPYLNIKKVALEIGVSPTTLWRFFNKVNKNQTVDMDTLKKLEDIGLLKAPMVISGNGIVPEYVYKTK